jgi:dynein heavy chain
MQLTLAPGFKSPDPLKFDREQYRKYIEEKLPIEQPQMFGLHPNAEIGYLTTMSETLFATIMSVQGGSGGGGGDDSKVKSLILTLLSTLPTNFNMFDVNAKAKNKTPYVVVCLQECERMNILLDEIRDSLNDLDSGLKGSLNITDAMELLQLQLNMNLVAGSWEKYAYFSKKNLLDWFADMKERVTQLTVWCENLETPPVVWISGLFNPMSYLTAIMQVTARAALLPLDDMCLVTDILNTKEKGDFNEFAEVGAYINGFFLEGAGWELGRGGEQGYLTEMQLKDLHPIVPVVHVTARTRAERVVAGVYECPVYMTSMRGGTYVFTAGMKMESEETDPNKWILAGVALLMSPE